MEINKPRLRSCLSKQHVESRWQICDPGPYFPWLIELGNLEIGPHPCAGPLHPLNRGSLWTQSRPFSWNLLLLLGPLFVWIRKNKRQEQKAWRFRAAPLMQVEGRLLSSLKGQVLGRHAGIRRTQILEGKMCSVVRGLVSLAHFILVWNLQCCISDQL